MVAPPPGQYDLTYSGALTNPVFFTQASHYALPDPASTPSIGTQSPAYYMLIQTTISTYQPPSIILPYYPQLVYATPYTYTLIVSQTSRHYCSTKVAHLRSHLFIE
ncbi:hypothetical protein PVK06_034948 [Gossypium arboreum]|uniref:Uncharacterized protein n=1 Tax=Gossypium arboreum TaxID=29729 RepID=A0ABR0NFJ9_GOSAR|nr:hypothetical protein PVK06_034948 [Gossypium arboreum]